MDKYFTKEESENIIALLKSKDIESIKLGFTLIKTHSKFKNFKKLIPYNETRRFSYKETGHKYSNKNNVSEEINTLLKLYILDHKHISDSFYSECRFLLKFIKTRTK